MIVLDSWRARDNYKKGLERDIKEVIDVCWNEVNKKDIYSYSGVVSELRDLFYQIEQLDDIPENQGLCWIKTYPEEYIDDELGVYLSIITKE